MSIKISGTTVIDNSKNIKAGIGTFDSLNVPPQVLTFSPTDGATDIDATSNIVITFDQTIQKGSGNITLRNGSNVGAAITTIPVSSSEITLSGSQVIINPVNNLPNGTDVYVVVDSGAFLGVLGSPNNIIDTYNFVTLASLLGTAQGGGYLICCSSSVCWIVSCSSAEVSRTWYSRGDSVTRAQAVSGCTGWFVPTLGQLGNPGYTCRSYWDSFSLTEYWSDCCSSNGYACTFALDFSTGATGVSYRWKSLNKCVRAFRCVTY